MTDENLERCRTIIGEYAHYFEVSAKEKAKYERKSKLDSSRVYLLDEIPMDKVKAQSGIDFSQVERDETPLIFMSSLEGILITDKAVHCGNNYYGANDGPHSVPFEKIEHIRFDRDQMELLINEERMQNHYKFVDDRKALNAMTQGIVKLRQPNLSIYDDPFDEDVDPGLKDWANQATSRFLVWIFNSFVLIVLFFAVRACQA